VLSSLWATTRSRLELAAEILVLRHQLAVLQRTTTKRPRFRPIDRLLCMLLSTVWPNGRRAVQIVTPATMVRWHRRAFATYWRWNSRPRRVGRPPLASDLRALIRQMRDANPLWGAPRIHGELQKLGIDVAHATAVSVVAHLPHQSRLLSEGEVRSDKGSSVNLADRDPFNADYPHRYDDRASLKGRRFVAEKY
jgi:hypothetical protein